MTRRTHTPRARTSAHPANDAGKRMRYIPALDGLRTLAVAAVVLYHLHLPWAQGGLLGVTVFFALSGYLITRLLIGEFERTGTIDLKSFWVRRVRRLLPAIGTVILATVVLCTCFNHVMLTKMRPDIIPSLLFVNNWWQIINQVSYFNALGDPSPLTHFWSLAIEEQFYLVWPPVLFVLLRCGVKRAWVRRIALGAAAASAVAMAVLYDPAADPSRLYYGTDTRAFSLLLGAWLAFIPERSMTPARLLEAVGLDRVLPASVRATLPGDGDEPTDSELAAINGATPSSYAAATRRGVSRRQQSSARRASTPARSTDLLAVAGLVGLALMVAFTNGYTSFQYQGGTLLATLLTLLVIAGCVQEGGLVARLLALPPLVWLGKRSYSIYLWHYPLLLLMNPVSRVSQTPWWLMIIQVVVVVGAAELSYHFVETPCRQGAIGKAVRRMRERGLHPVASVRTRPVPAVALALVLAIALGGLALVPDTSALSEEGAAVLNQGDAAASSSAEANGGTSPDTPANGSESGSATDSSAAADSGDFPEGSYDILWIGDSVSLMCVEPFEQLFPHGHIDALKNRQFKAGIEVYEGYLSQNLSGKIVVIALGTNGLVTDELIDTLMADIGTERYVVFVNTRHPQPWLADTNAALQRATERYDNAHLVDWYSYSEGRDDLFDGDGTHLKASGAKEYVQLVYEAVRAELPVHPEDHVDDPQPALARDAANKLLQALSAGLAPHPLGAQAEGSAA